MQVFEILNPPQPRKGALPQRGFTPPFFTCPPVVWRKGGLGGIIHVLFFLLLASCFLLHSAHSAELGEIEVHDSSEHESSFAPTSFTTVIKPKPQQNKTVTEIVSQSPGVQAKDLGGPGQFSTVTIRGSSAEQVAVFIDGVKINTAQGGGVDFSAIPPEIIERIEIIRGGGTTQFGADAIGGAINIITKKAKDGRVIELRETGGSFTTFKSSESWAERREKFGFVLSHTHAQSAGDYTFKSAETNLAGGTVGGGQTFTRLHNGFISEDLLTKADYSPVKNLKLDLSNNFFFTKREIPGVEEETTLLYPTNPLEAKETILKNITNGTAELSGLFNNHFTLETGISNNRATDDFQDASPSIGTAIHRKTLNNLLNPYFLLKPSFSNKYFTHLISLRYDYRRDYFNDSSPIAGTTLTGTKRRNSHGIFFQDEVVILHDKISLVPAVRYEDASDFPDDVSLKIGVAARPRQWLTFKGNVESSFRYPNFSELYFPDQGYLRGNSGLAKEEAVNYDVGVLIEIGNPPPPPFKKGGLGGISIELTYFRNDIKNQIIWVPVSATTIQPINTFDVTAQGVEAAAEISPFNFLTLGANYTFLTAHFDSNNLQLPGRPRHKINSHLDMHHNFTERFGGNIFGEFQYTSALPVNTQNTVFIASRSMMNAGIGAHFSPAKKKFGAYSLTFDAKDITNVQIYDARGFPLPRRAFFVTLGVKWS